VQAAINSLKINKTPWNDSISAELLEQVGYLHTRMIHWGGGGSGSVVHVGCIQTRRLVVPPDQVLRFPWASSCSWRAGWQASISHDCM